MQKNAIHAENQDSLPVATPQPTQPNQPSPQPPLVLLRFSQQTREELEHWEYKENPDKPHVNTHHLPHFHDQAQDRPSPRPPRRKRRVLRFLVGMLLFLLGLATALSAGLLELRYRNEWQHGLQEQRKARALAALQGALQTTTPTHPSPTEHPALATFHKAAQALEAAHQRLCQPPAKPRVPTTDRVRYAQAQAREWMRHWQEWLWIHLGKTFEAQRQKLWKPKESLTPTRKQFCQRSPRQLHLAARAVLVRYHRRLLKQARRHMQEYGWCRMRWSRYQELPQHNQWLKQLRQRQCRKACGSSPTGASSLPDAQCTSCLQKWRGSLGLDTPRFQRYHQMVLDEDSKRCHRWGNRPAYGGVFHLGAYYWRVAQVLAHARWLQHQKLCDQTCLGWQRQWGTRLSVKSQPGPGRIYVRLWSSLYKAPTPALASLEQIFVGMTGRQQPIWLPALRQDLLAQATPRDFWIRLRVHHPKSQRDAHIPILPQAGKALSLQVTLHKQELHNDGRLPVRYPTISPNGSQLAFVTYQVMPWETTPDPGSPHCWRSTSQQTLSWRSALSLYPLNIQGQPDTEGQHLYSPQWLREIRLVHTPSQPHLLVTSVVSPGTAKPPTTPANAPPFAAGIGTWKLDLSMSLGLSAQRAVQLTQPVQGMLDLPVAYEASALLFRRSCATAAQDPQGSLQLLQVPPVKPPQITAPVGYQTIHVAQNRDWLALLLHPLQSQTGAIMALYNRRSETVTNAQPTKMIPLRLRHRQITATREGFLLAGGGWGAPIQEWSSQGLRNVAPGDPKSRYLDPVQHPQSQRIFAIQQQRTQGAERPSSHATFLLSWQATPKPQAMRPDE